MAKVRNIPYYFVAVLACVSAFMAGGLISSGISFAQEQGDMRGQASILINLDIRQITQIPVGEL